MVRDSYQALASWLLLSIAGAPLLGTQLIEQNFPGPCASQPCIYGVCIATATGGYRCYCQNGFTGLNCQTNYDDCRSEPCVNGGSCIDGIEDFICMCSQGYTGQFCETDINECLSDPCLNGGLCEDLINDYICHCPLGYEGINCENYYNICAIETDLCQNGGSCNLGPSNTSSCSCPPNFFGEKCELPVCPCIRGGVCIGEQDVSCLCPFGWTGLTCETKVDVCEESICNGGLCILDASTDQNSTSNITCFCIPDYHGKFCELQYDECIPEPSCNNGATCVDDVDGYSCICPAGFLGSTCNETFKCLGEECSSLHHKTSSRLSPSASELQTSYSSSLISSPANDAVDIDFQTLSYGGPSTEPSILLYPSEILPSTTFNIHLTIIREQPHHSTQSLYQFKDTTDDDLENELSTYFDGWNTTALSPSSTMQIYSSSAFLSFHLIDKSSLAVGIVNSFQSSSFIASLSPQSILTINSTSAMVPMEVNGSDHFKEKYSIDDIPSNKVVQPSKVFSSKDIYTTIVFTDNNILTNAFSGTDTETTIFSNINGIHTSELLSHLTDTHASEVFLGEVPNYNSVVSQNTTKILQFSSTIHSMPVYPSDEAGRSVLSASMECQNGGSVTLIMVELEEDVEQTCKCVCPLLYSGTNCEKETYLLIPQFHRTSFLKHAVPLFDPEKGIDIDISFKVSSAQGMILFTEATSGGSFLMLYIDNGLLKFSFSCGHQTTVFMETHASVNNSFFTTVSISISWTATVANVKDATCNVGLLVNGSAPMSGQQLVLSPKFDFRHVYIGGVPVEFESSIPEVHGIPSLEGCVLSLQINGDERQLVEDAEVGAGITECYSSACYRNPCFNDATCRSYEDHWNCECVEGYAGPFCEHKTCFANPCEHGSTCLPSFEFGFLCICPYGKHGKTCEHDLLITRPSFYGDLMGYSSYLQYQLLADYHYHLEIRLMFSVSNLMPKSLLLFNGQLDSFNLASDFLAVGLNAGYIFYTFNLGSGTRTLKSISALNKNIAVHSVLIGRHKRYCWLEVDSQTKVVGLAAGQLTALNTQSAVYIGGHSSYNFSLLPDELRSWNGFGGCMIGVQFRSSPGAVFREFQPVVDGRNIQQCSSTECELIQCNNGGTCVDVGSTFECKCKKGWVGALCSQKETSCSSGNHKCHPVALCVPNNNGYRCDCPLGRSGRYCEKNITISDPLFDGTSSYLTIRMRNVRQSMDMQIGFKAHDDEGLIFYAAQHLNELSRDFVSLSLSAGHVHFRFNLGTDPGSTIVLRSSHKVVKDSWQTVEFGRYRRAAYLKLQDDEEVTSISPPGMEILDIKTDFYLGGIPDLSSLPKKAFATVPSYFKGCIQFLTMNNQIIELNSNHSVSGRNVADCDGTACGFSSCKNGGTCVPRKEGFSCECPPMFMGKTCEVSEQCWQHHCLHGAKCIPTGESGHRCSCSIGWRGERCEIGVNVSSAYFSGSSYLFYKDITYRHLDRTKTSITFNFSSNERSGLLFWSSKTYSEDSDYIGIGLRNHQLHLVWNLGWMSKSEIVTKPLDHEKRPWHSISIERHNQILNLHVDGTLYTSQVSGDFYELNNDGSYYFGGFPRTLDVNEETLGFFTNHFVGCIKDITISGHSVNIMNIKEGQNLERCQQSG